MESKVIRKAGLKVTSPRIKVLEILEDSKDRHLSAETIYKSLIENGEEFGLATVYRVLNQFESAGLVVKHNFDSGNAVYELDDRTHHDHMVCVETDKVIEFFDQRIEDIQKEIADRNGYELEGHSLVLYVKPKKK
ncbi:MAG: ferric iron uptake transcriptional regulator [Gammaproteobacteria bacterium TMED78]|nr:MAG: ferric iron uptake transcriptional regulator [Gammaproteobacteria bacterium TMED78]|tara:strand:- start:771 stop:1175 length:405 start_codon:yes stop_codon:yes gene_type:complete